MQGIYLTLTDGTTRLQRIKNHTFVNEPNHLNWAVYSADNVRDVMGKIATDIFTIGEVDMRKLGIDPTRMCLEARTYQTDDVFIQLPLDTMPSANTPPYKISDVLKPEERYYVSLTTSSTTLWLANEKHPDQLVPMKEDNLFFRNELDVSMADTWFKNTLQVTQQWTPNMYACHNLNMAETWVTVARVSDNVIVRWGRAVEGKETPMHAPKGEQRTQSAFGIPYATSLPKPGIPEVSPSELIMLVAAALNDESMHRRTADNKVTVGVMVYGNLPVEIRTTLQEYLNPFGWITLVKACGHFTAISIVEA